jgi:hypothetical protein
MQPILRTTILAAVLTVLGGCRSVQSPPWYTGAWRGFPYQEVKEKLNEYRSVLLVCVTEDHGEQGEEEFGGIKQVGPYLHHYKATVVRSYKGHCHVADRVAFVAGNCPCGGKREVTTSSCVGKLIFLLVEEKVRVNAEFGIDPFDVEPYDPQTDRLFTHVFRGYETKQKGSQQVGCTEPRDGASVEWRALQARGR